MQNNLLSQGTAYISQGVQHPDSVKKRTWEFFFQTIRWMFQSDLNPIENWIWATCAGSVNVALMPQDPHRAVLLLIKQGAWSIFCLKYFSETPEKKIKLDKNGNWIQNKLRNPDTGSNVCQIFPKMSKKRSHPIT